MPADSKSFTSSIYVQEKKIHGKKLFLCWQLVNIWMIVPAAIVSVGDILLSVVRSDV